MEQLRLISEFEKERKCVAVDIDEKGMSETTNHDTRGKKLQ